MNCAECGVDIIKFPHVFEDPDRRNQPGEFTRLCDECCPRCWGGPGKGPEPVSTTINK